MRVTGLDESVTPEEVVEAVAKKGGCSTNEVTAGKMHPGQGDTKLTLARCPAWAAKKVAEGAKIKVGWSLAKVVLSRRVHCFKCMVARRKRTGAPCASGAGLRGTRRRRVLPPPDVWCARRVVGRQTI
ncbi:unnamed protein product [Chilo suppressalis]|uniref:BRCT domain-containing protein n=1 Tax=Chilo suppressalis TaxID=168631 RepID=A0ABN8AXF1_CHISP|nr:unnamed protein product [Chilo suppressalis]